MTDRFVPLDVNTPDDPKIQAVGHRAELLFYRALCLSKRLQSDGFVSAQQVTGSLRSRLADAKRLCDVGLFEIFGDGFLIVAWLKHNPTRAELEVLRAENAERTRRWREAQRARSAATTAESPDDVTRHDDVTDDACDASHEHTDASRDAPCDASVTSQNLNLNSNGEREQPQDIAPPQKAADATHPGEVSTSLAIAVPEVLPAKPNGRKPDDRFEALAEACGIDWRGELTRTERQKLNAALKQLKEVHATADEIRERALAFRMRYTVALTAHGLVGNWAQLGRPEPNGDAIRTALAVQRAYTRPLEDM